MFKRLLKSLIVSSVVGTALLLSGGADAFQAPKDGKTTTSSKTTPAPTDADIAAAKTKGLVWVNTSTKVYHKDGEFYGKTKQGKFMTEADAQKGGFHAAKEPGGAKKTGSTAKK